MSAPSRAKPDPRSGAQIADEQAAAEISSVLLNLEHALARARKAHRRLLRLPASSPGPAHAAAIADLIPALNQLRRDLMQRCYFHPPAAPPAPSDGAQLCITASEGGRMQA